VLDLALHISRSMRFLRVFSALLIVSGCGHDGGKGGDDVDGSITPPSDTDPLSGLPTGTAQWSALCAKGYGDIITQKFCAGGAPPTLSGLADLETLLGLTVVPNPNGDPTLNTNVRFTLNGESTGVGIRGVNPITPRAFLMTPPLAGGGPNPTYQVMSFARGEPLVEMVANDPTAQTLRFFLIRFHPACEPSCTFADLQTATIESGWTGYTIYDDATIANTTLDCLNCHQPGGPTTKKILRMQELINPWGHWFYPERPATLAIVQAFQTAHPNENYAGIPYQNVYGSRPFVLMQLAQNNGFASQPNAFDTLTINNELAASGTSATWQALYANAVAGKDIPPPYFTNAYDPTKLQAATTAYQQTVAGALPPAQMPDVRDVFLDSALADMSIRPKAGLDGAGILVHMCQMCHNSKLDQTLSRARFNVENLAQMSRAEKDIAIQRLQLPSDDRHAMPPARFKELSAAEQQLVIAELQK
jgi:hypothetical protein